MGSNDFELEIGAQEEKAEAAVSQAVRTRKYQLSTFFGWLANMVYNKQEMQYPSNILDAVSYILSTDSPRNMKNWDCGIPEDILAIAYRGDFVRADKMLGDYRMEQRRIAKENKNEKNQG